VLQVSLSSFFMFHVVFDSRVRCPPQTLKAWQSSA
jgi:hypothetical protein